MDISQRETEVLRRLGYLAERDLEQRDRIAQALHSLLANVILDDV
jgi:hypothetical protein